MRKIFFFIWSLFLLLQLTGCQGQRPQNSYANDSGNHFRVVWNELYYNGKPIKNMLITDFIRIAGSENYRVMDYSRKGGGFSEWYWWKKKLYAISSTENGKKNITVNKLKVYEYEPLSYIPDVDNEEGVYNSIEEVIAKYGMYDSIKTHITHPLKMKGYIWDDYGFEVQVINDSVGGFFISPIPARFCVRYSPAEYDSDADSIERRKKYEQEISRYPATAFRGKFSWEDNTVDFAKTEWDDWDKIVKNLGLAGSEYDGPQDGKYWEREIRMSKVGVTMMRLDNNYSPIYPSASEVGFRINFVYLIEIGLYD